ncbi:uncharacterized protein LOC107273106 [Cephus cinctus]|uniref:Uncharacterized protein LOC107273106 n=1 Tax=Cephus cinctus TaxID=211228 RepID=A0AAJ7CBH1_CEPCN|nr:uncharacterized protein LOC107273106 [Cephus cinctus]
MVSRCNLCTHMIPETDLVKTGAECKHVFHPRSVKQAMSLQTSRGANKAIKKHCPACSRPVIEQQSVLPIGVQTLLQSVERKLGGIDQMNASIIDLSRRVDALTVSNEDLKKETKELRNVVVSMKAACEDLDRKTTDRFDAYEKRLKQLEASTSGDSTGACYAAQERRLLRLESRSMATDSVVTGVPEEEDESLKEVGVNIAQVLGVRLEKTEVLQAVRMGKQRTKRVRPILYQLAIPAKCEEIIEGKKKKRDLRGADFSSKWNNELKIYINRRVPAALNRLRQEELMKYKHIPARSVWIADGAVFIRKEKDSMPIHIGSLAELDSLID